MLAMPKFIQLNCGGPIGFGVAVAEWKVNGHYENLRATNSLSSTGQRVIIDWLKIRR